MVVRIELDNIEDILSKIKNSSGCAKDAKKAWNYNVPYYVRNSYGIGSDIDDLEQSTKILFSQLEDVRKTLSSFMSDSNHIMRNDFSTKAEEYICAILGSLLICENSPNTNLKAHYLQTTKNYYRDTYDDFMVAGGEANDQFTQEEIDQFLKAREQTIEIYEDLYPKDAKKMDELLGKMAKDDSYDYSTDIQNIKYIAYTADEPYRSTFFKHIDDITIGDYDYGKGAHFRPLGNRVFVDINNVDKGVNNPRGSYATLFHEIGHGIDDVSDKGGFFAGNDNHTTETYANKNGQTLQEVAREDVRGEIYNIVDEETNFSLSDKELSNITDRLMDPTTSLSDEHSRLIVGLNAKVKEELNLRGPDNALASDVYGGFTGNKFQDDYGHNEEYWHYSNGESKGMESKEFFAEAFSSAMLGNQEAIDSQKDNFPEAYGMFENMVEDISGE